MPHPANAEGPSVAGPQASFHFAVSSTIAPPPPAIVVNSRGALGIPAMALTAYRNAERLMAQAMPDCGVSWNLLAGIGRIESQHAFGGATDPRGNAINPIYGPALDGSLPGNEIIVQSRSNHRTTYARAMGPMQFLPVTWTRYTSDGDGDGQANPQNLFDSTLAAARYLCSGGLNLRDQSQVITAVLRYNNSMPYTQNVLGWAAAYTTGVLPVNLPPITGPIRPISDTYLVTNPTNVDPADSGPGATQPGPGDDGTAVDQAGGNGGAANARNVVAPGVKVGNGRNGGAANARNVVAPGVKVGNGRNGGARGTGR
jgi:hypothetical protein